MEQSSSILRSFSIGHSEYDRREKCHIRFLCGQIIDQPWSKTMCARCFSLFDLKLDLDSRSCHRKSRIVHATTSRAVDWNSANEIFRGATTESMCFQISRSQWSDCLSSKTLLTSSIWSFRLSYFSNRRNFARSLENDNYVCKLKENAMKSRRNFSNLKNRWNKSTRHWFVGESFLSSTRIRRKRTHPLPLFSWNIKKQRNC